MSGFTLAPPPKVLYTYLSIFPVNTELPSEKN